MGVERTPAGPGAGTPEVSVVLVSWNAADVIGPCLESLRGGPHEIVVVDNASADGTGDLVSARFPEVRLIRHRENRGFAGGVNAGIRASRGQFVLLLNCDTNVHPGAIERLRDALAARAECGAAGGCLVDADGTAQHGFHVRRFPTLATWAVDLWLIDKVWPDNPVTRRYLAFDQTRDATGPVEVDQPAAACLMLRREAVEGVGGLDEGFHPAWFEDVDLCRRLRSAGWRILHVPAAVFTHRGGEAMRALGLHAFSRAWYRNLLRDVRKHQGPLAALCCRGLIVSGMALRMVAVLLRGRPAEAGAYGRVALDALGVGTRREMW